MAGLDLTKYATITIWDPWNEWHRNPIVEPNWGSKYTIRATYAQMVRMTQDLRCIVKGVGASCTQAGTNPSANIITPSALPQTTENFLHCDAQPVAGSECITGDEGSNLVDLNGRHFYEIKYPEHIIGDVNAYKSLMHATDLDKPFMSSEGGWGKDSTYADIDMQAAFVARCFIVGASLNLIEMYWYAYDSPTWGTLYMNESVTKAGVAYGQVSNWLIGSTVPTCQQSGSLWSCTFVTSSGVPVEALWDTSKTCSNGSCTSSIQSVGMNWQTYEAIDGTVGTVNESALLLRQTTRRTY